MSGESTTPDPVELGRGLLEAFNRRDFDAIESLYAEDAVVVGAMRERFDGAAAIRGLYEDMATPYGDLRSEIDEEIDLGNGIGFAVVTGVGHLVGSAVDVPFRVATVAVWADGVIVRQRNYMDIDEARAAAERLAAERA